ncbi:MAG: DUF2723 domain-containing protein [Chitinispirillaceae bacterium]|nr:DUF2723 domain-containing protein [Chitinispirillaceae bacterium]
MEPAAVGQRTHRRINALAAAGVFVTALAAYVLTVAPTVCFWDCGEYTAACHGLEIPHPPGNPLYIMIGRVATLALFFLNDPGLRLNLVSSVSGAFTAMLICLIIVRAFTGWTGIPETAWKRLVVYGSGVIGGLYAAFGSTMWFCSVEAEVNAPVMVPITLCAWLVLVWAQSGDRRRDRLLLLITYLAYLGIGIHMYSMISLGPLFLYVIIVDREKRRDWRLWITGALMGLVIYDISWFMLAGTAAAVAALSLSLVERKNLARWRFCFYLAIFGMLGFSSHLYIPIRSALNPMIDENHPATYQAFRDYLARKQYGSESMITRMFWRRGSWSRQFGIEGHMGFGGFFLTQFFRLSPFDTQKNFLENGGGAGWGKLLVYLLPVFFVLYGMYFFFRKKKSIAVLLGSLLLMTTVVLVQYHNFSDGTRSEKRDYKRWSAAGRKGPEPLVHREVRVRDYFYIAGFAFYGMWIGIAGGALLYCLYASRRRLLRTTVAPVCTILFAASPALPLVQNMPRQSRRGDFIPYDYAYNLLMSCEKDGLLFTNGDNDTFPLWALQEAYGIRRDVRIINFSLLNTKWYIKQLKRLEPRVPMTYADDMIEKLGHAVNPVTEPASYALRDAGITVSLPPRSGHQLMRIQDQMVLSIVDAVRWTRPMYMAITVSDDNLMGLGPYMQMQGLVYRIMPALPAESAKVDVGRHHYLLERVYRFRGLGGGGAPRTETSERLLSNYSAAFMQLAVALRKPLMDCRDRIAGLENAAAGCSGPAALLAEERKRYADTLAVVLDGLKRCISLVPWDWRPRALLHEFLLIDHRLAEAENRMREALRIQPDNTQYLRMMAQVLDMQGRKQEAAGVIRTMMESGRDLWDTYNAAAREYAANGAFDSALLVLQEYADAHPRDRRAAAAIAGLQEMKKRPAVAAEK